MAQFADIATGQLDEGEEEESEVMRETRA